ncbi:MAG: DUF2442 domain-containing protein [Acidobacteria bacterium]|nr:DUF2442 domain-containing protein [Acidobacteriota bacterium]
MPNQTRVTSLHFSPATLHVALADGRELSLPLARFPRLAAATPQQLDDWHLIGRGLGIHWTQLGEDLSVESLLASE